ncbi:hypothetical protein BG454_06785 [Roseinatronobacter bogoriensis subsp. barguzinensis]|uniref:Uncharacterized protein n=1 Tax=Roseinatronobacter bogoriensis subsp. barguzinensis TaxID=441209 RepID=A0A2K8K9F9_9RHOB|nr:hypothetical protein BG454_06785 [Rhodobaca barguzinensis]
MSSEVIAVARQSRLLLNVIEAKVQAQYCAQEVTAYVRCDDNDWPLRFGPKTRATALERRQWPRS